MKIEVPYGKDGKITVEFPEENFYFAVDRIKKPAVYDLKDAIRSALRAPVGTSPLSDMVKHGDKVLIVADDLTRPTPQKLILPVLLDELNAVGVPDRDIGVLIALGTHRPMREEEIEERFGSEVLERVPVMNHNFRDSNVLVNLGRTESNIDVYVNKSVGEADFVIGVGNIVPHVYGWGGGSKIIQPGVCGEETTGMTHIIGGRTRPLVPKLTGKFENPIMDEIRAVALKAGLKFIVNTVLNHEDKVAQVFAGDPIEAHRKGVEYAEGIYCPEIPGYADIVIVSSYPADIDYWQAIKPLDFGIAAVKEGGTVILVTPCPERVAPTHPAFLGRALLDFDENLKAREAGEIDDLVAGATLLDHAQILERAEVICYSDGLTRDDKEALGFRDASTIEEAIEMALEREGKNAKIGVLKCGEILPRVKTS